MDVSLGLMPMLGVVTIGAAYVALPVFVQAYRRFAGPRVVTCPETSRLTAIALDARRAALSSVVGRPHFRVAACGRWPAERGCGQECVAALRECTGREVRATPPGANLFT